MKLSTKSAERVQVSERDSVGITKLEGTLSASGMRFALVCARFNEFITARLLEGARDGLLRLGASESEIVEVMVPGALEIPQAARALAETNLFDAIVGVGAVIRGETAHFDVVVNQSASGLSSVAAQYNVVVTNAILTTDTIEQAINRSGAKAGNKGFEAAMVAVEMADLVRKVRLLGKND
ncbi:6,7-dimethyl-8-ribityllumazine synthase [Ferrithrix thermotolerans DSM 19514]|jgi:6,7-dimethyl-8-ribityllumazine synthase|uniref:6,7-dimethyl-8-ribityllumazine synthase n=2 Tax=Ferrithrix TaxID=643949 RepID=A0A1M4S6B2_9ACTN|nr:6,7-dimethyl-8-ribityllumazine synthase [Ferrithrix thermotolerans DSM 19514]